MTRARARAVPADGGGAAAPAGAPAATARPRATHKLAPQILEHIRDAGLAPGAHLTELGLAGALNVSRTPVRAALEQLAELGVVAPAGPRRGHHVVVPPERIAELLDDTGAADEEEALYLRIAQDYLANHWAEQVSESDLARRYGVHRSLLYRVLQRMRADQVVERSAGYGWRFAPLLRSVEAHDDSYRFRLAIEPAAIEQPGFRLDEAWAARSRHAHEAVLAMPPQRLSMVRFFAMNADFHEGVAACAHNPYFHRAVQQQNQIRRFQNYAWTYGHERVVACCREHLDILAALEAGDRPWAATLMRRHLELACRIKPAAPR